MANLIGAYIEITGRCNASCPYCYNRQLVPSAADLPRSLLHSLFSELYKEHITAIAISGGEPFLHPDIGGIIQDATEKGLSLMIISNGTCFIEEHLPLLLKYQPSLQLTFDGWDDESHDNTRGNGNFRLLINGILKARASGYKGIIRARINLHKSNISHLKDILCVIDTLNSQSAGKFLAINDINLSIIHATENGGGSFSEYVPNTVFLENADLASICNEWNESHNLQISYDKNMDLGCAYDGEPDSVNCSFRIALNGSVFPCQMFTDERYSLGNLYLNTLEEILRGEPLQAFIKQVRSRRDNLSECQSCGYQGFCHGGCPANALIENGDINTVTSSCHLRKAMMNKLLFGMMKKNPKGLVEYASQLIS